MLKASTVPSLVTFKQRGQDILSRQNFIIDLQFDLDLWSCDFKINRSHILPRDINFTTFKQRDQERKHLFKDQQFDLDLSPCDLKINRSHLLPRDINCTKFGHFQAKGSRYWADYIISKTSSLILTFDHVTSKSIRVIYSLGHLLYQATSKQRGQNIMSRQRFVYRWVTQVTNKELLVHLLCCAIETEFILLIKPR